MKFDYFVTHTRGAASETFEQLYADGLEQVQLCDQIGIDTVWFPEHQFTNQLCSPAPLVSVVDAAHRTRRTRLGTAVIITPYYHPLLTAGQVALADQLTQGRLEVGFGRGGYKYEYERLAMTEPLAAARQQEALEVILRAWTESDFSYSGTHFKFAEVTVVPRPFQRPCPPTWIAARTPDSMRFAAEHGIGIMMAPQRQPIGRIHGQMRLLTAICEDLGVSRPPVRVSRELWVTRSKAEAQRVAELLQEYHTVQWNLHQNAAPTVDGFTEAVPLPQGYDISPAELIARGVIGDPEHCVARLREYEALGADSFVANFDWGQPQRDILRALELFAEHVMPHFADDRPAARPAPDPHGRARTAVREPVTIDIEGLGGDWTAWEADEWLGQFERVRAAERRRSYIFDFATAPKVRAHADGAVDVQGLLRLVSDVGCPDCGRPVIALYRRWEGEERAAITRHLAERMRELGWHERHTNRRARGR
jgi:alkanesulfonate monooxygenase SsuD/methylene tetrahydromethanopterin reductase-like flavin-dependent oxidoreductase (luciferase family)